MRARECVCVCVDVDVCVSVCECAPGDFATWADAHEHRLSTRLSQAPLQSFCRSQLHHKSVNVSFISVIVQDKFTDLWGSRLVQNDFKSTLCEIRPEEEK